MKRIFGVLLFAFVFLSMSYAVAQRYDDQRDTIVDAMDRVVEQHNAVYVHVAPAGDGEESLSSEERYTSMTEPVDDAIDQHFNMITESQTVEETTADIK
jgi:hypothetical protein